MSDVLTALTIAQLSERAELKAVFADLFDVDGAIVEFRPAGWFAPATPCVYAALVAAGAHQRVSVIGYRLAADSHRTVINPPKSNVVHLAPDDQVLVVGLRRPVAPPTDDRAQPAGEPAATNR